MSAHEDWAAVDAIHVSLPTIVSSTDLFDGELFGDELIDIYNSTVEEHDHGKVIGRFVEVVCKHWQIFCLVSNIVTYRVHRYFASLWSVQTRGGCRYGRRGRGVCVFSPVHFLQ